MWKRTTVTTVTPLPAGVSRAVVLDMLHSHEAMIDLNPLVKERHPIEPPKYAPADEATCVWYSLTDKVSYLPGGLVTSDVTYTCAFHDLPDGLQTHCYAPAGLNIRDKWTVHGTEPVELGIGAPASGLYLREDVDMRCNRVMSAFVKKTLRRAHATLVERLAVRAQNISSGVGIGSVGLAVSPPEVDGDQDGWEAAAAAGARPARRGARHLSITSVSGGSSTSGGDNLGASGSDAESTSSSAHSVLMVGTAPSEPGCSPLSPLSPAPASAESGRGSRVFSWSPSETSRSGSDDQLDSDGSIAHTPRSMYRASYFFDDGDSLPTKKLQRLRRRLQPERQDHERQPLQRYSQPHPRQRPLTLAAPPSLGMMARPRRERRASALQGAPDQDHDVRFVHERTPSQQHRQLPHRWSAVAPPDLMAVHLDVPEHPDYPQMSPYADDQRANPLAGIALTPMAPSRAPPPPPPRPPAAAQMRCVSATGTGPLATRPLFAELESRSGTRDGWDRDTKMT